MKHSDVACVHHSKVILVLVCTRLAVVLLLFLLCCGNRRRGGLICTILHLSAGASLHEGMPRIIGMPVAITEY